MQIILRRRCKHIEEPLSCIADLQYTRHIATSITVIGCAPNGAESVIVQDLVAFLAELMCAQDVRHVVYFEELFHDLRAKGVACSAGGQGEFVAFWIGVGPDEIGHRAFVGDFAEAIDDFDLVNRVDGGGEAYGHAR